MKKSALRHIAANALIFVFYGCSALDVSDPTAIEESDLQNTQGAQLLRRDAVGKLFIAVSDGMIATGLLSDEFYGPYAGDEVDRRESLAIEQMLVNAAGGEYARWQEVRRAATLAIPQLTLYGGLSAGRAYAGEMFAVRGYAELALAETFCPGFPLFEIHGFTPTNSPPLSTDQVFEHALANFDSAVANASDSARILNFARVGRARSLVGLGRFAEAAAVAATVPTGFSWNAEYNSTFTPVQANWFGYFSESGIEKYVTVAESEGGNGLNFVTAQDPRVQTFRRTNGPGPLGEMFGVAKYPNRAAPIVVASGIEARLIEAEAAFDAADPSWLPILNSLRATRNDPALPPLTDPGTETERVDLLFRERAFWLFGTGHRVGDLRRMISRYGRSSESVFPTGLYPTGGTYGMATSIPFPAELEKPFNSAVTGCTSR